MSLRLTAQITEPFLPSKKVQTADSLSADKKSALCNLIDKYADIFVGPDGKLGKCGIIKHKIELIDNTPIRRRAYWLNPKQKNIMETKINELIKLGVIEESTSPWSAPGLLLAKQGVKDYRVIACLRGLDDKTVLAVNEFPTIIESLENISMQQPKYFSVFDLHSGFFHAALDEESKQYTAFNVPNMGLFQYTRLPQGLNNSPQTFTMLMQAVLRDLYWKTCAFYIDDIIVYHSQSFSDHLNVIEAIIKRLQQSNFKLKSEKCQFGKSSIKYLGHIVDSNGLTVDSDKVACLVSYPPPKNAKELRVFLGLV